LADWPPDGLAQRRASYTRTLAILIHRHAQKLVDAWDPASGNFLAQVENAGSGASVYESAQRAMNAITNAMFYVEVEVKDVKIATPAGISDFCPTASCPDAVESPWSDRSLEHIEQNLIAFERLYYGGAPGVGVDGGAPTTGGNGFDDLLRTIGQDDLAMRVEAALASAREAVPTVPAPLETAVQSSLSDVEAFYQVLRGLTTLVKTEFIAILDLERPPVAGSDTD
ncbi:MAG: hypothetical protein H5U40_11630, partial [Polyangiaceae bacterium]|nr:hypothetical protein [Polyangiaceae bacterium]